MRDDGPDSLVADLVTIVVGPILIMIMVGSLAFFLVELLYAGQYAGRLYFIMAMFTLAIVLIARISMTEGLEKAMMYASLLAVVTCLAVTRFVEGATLATMCIIAVVWWLAHKLTWDCTIDDLSQDTTNVGLLEKAGLDPEASADRKNARDAKAAQNDEPSSDDSRNDGKPVSPEGTTSVGDATFSFWKRLFLHDQRFHAPGVWIVYFSLAALPIFGLGQLMLRASDDSGRAWAFTYLFCYSAAGLALLMTTSFLALRRYLHKRGARMPLGVAASWCLGGPAIILVILIVALFLPRPGVNDALSEMPISIQVTSPDLEESEVQVGEDGADENRDDRESEAQGRREPSDAQKDSEREGQATGDEASERAQGQQSNGEGASDKGENGEKGESSQGEQGKGGESDQNGKNEGQVTNETSEQNGEENRSANGEESEPKDDKQGQEAGENDDSQQRQGSGSKSSSQQEQQEREDKQSDEEKQNDDDNGSKSQSKEESSWRMPEVSFQISGGLLGVLKLIFYVLLAIAVIYFVIRNGRAILQGFAELLKGLRDFLANLFGGKRKRSTDVLTDEEDASPQRPSHLPFSAYVDPFMSGNAKRMRPDEVVRYTFEAFEAWSREHGVPRDPNRTPHEFARLIGDQFPAMEEQAKRLALLYVQTAYSPDSVTPQQAAVLREFWAAMDQMKRRGQYGSDAGNPT